MVPRIEIMSPSPACKAYILSVELSFQALQIISNSVFCKVILIKWMHSITLHTFYCNHASSSNYASNVTSPFSFAIFDGLVFLIK